MSEEKKHETINRNERYVAIGSFVSVILLVFVRSEKMLRNELNKIFISNTGVEYIEAEQMILSVVASSCLFLLGMCVVYIFFESKTYINNEMRAETQKKADRLYELIFYYIQIFALGILFFAVLAIFSDKMEFAKYAYIKKCLCLLAICSFVSIGFMRWKYKESKCTAPELWKDICGTGFFVVFCLVMLANCIVQEKMIDLRINYNENLIGIEMEGQDVFDEIDILIDGVCVESISAEPEKIFQSRSIEWDKDYSAEDASVSAFKRQNDIYYYFADVVDIGKFIDEGSNKIQILVKVEECTYVVSNWLEVDGLNYSYIKTEYETEIKIK